MKEAMAIVIQSRTAHQEKQIEFKNPLGMLLLSADRISVQHKYKGSRN
jgi:hypothetical protein